MRFLGDNATVLKPWAVLPVVPVLTGHWALTYV